MQNKGAIKILAIAIALVSFYQLFILRKLHSRRRPIHDDAWPSGMARQFPTLRHDRKRRLFMIFRLEFRSAPDVVLQWSFECREIGRASCRERV